MLRRSPIRRKPRTDPVPPTVVLAVFGRDNGCMAPRLGGSAFDCAGRLTVEHVKRNLRAGRRAEPVLECLITLCQGHTEPGAKAGYQWNTAKVNRAAMRAYLRDATTDCGHVDERPQECANCRARLS